MDAELKKKIVGHYERGEGSIQDIARVYRLEVAEVLIAIGQEELTTVEGIGDLVDQKEAGPDVEINTVKKHTAVFTTN